MEKVSLEEFTKLVYGVVSDSLKLATPEDIKEYMAEDETKGIIQEQYDMFVDNGFIKLDYNVNTVAYNLYMLF